jgi:transposase
VVALTFHAMLDTPDRFGGDARRAALVGVVPAERSSGERQQQGRITRAASELARCSFKQVGPCGAADHRGAILARVGPGLAAREAVASRSSP